MSGTTYVYNMRDLKFILKEWLDMGKILSLPPYAEYYDTDDIDFIVDNTFKVCRDKVAVVNDDADKIGVKFEEGKVVSPESFREAFRAVNEAGLGAGNADREAEAHLPYTIVQSNYEMLCAASLAFTGYWGLTTGAISVIQNYASEGLKEKFLPNMCAGEWGGTMNLTESGAGSDVGANVTKAFPTDEPGIYRIKGNKIFITGGDHDLCSNFIHLVLARIEGALPGTAGLSLFIVPKIWVNDDGSLGEPNDVVTTGLEEKMGLHGQPTCSLSYGENDGCRGYLIGDPPDENGKASGIRQMFLMMNEERLMIGIQGLAVTGAAYLHSLAYAKERVQGRKFTDPKGERVRIIEHEDVRRMLMTQKACSEAIRALVLKSCYYFDLSHDSEDAEEKAFADGMFQISNPMCKAYSTDMAWLLIADAIQIFGGYGFTSEYPVEQLARDCKVLSIWEGTNYIQAQDLVGRKFTMQKGQVLKNWLDDIGGFIESRKGVEGYDLEFGILSEAFVDLNAILQQIGAYNEGGKREMTPLFATRILHAAAMLYCGRLIVDQALLAGEKLVELGEDHFDAAYYKGKIASARFYVLNIVPQVGAIRRVIALGDASAVDIAEESFA
ncbi:MAG: acyl-CoA dehydrogenase [Clostridiales Family XIII bacterium]|nr:acyl-CoA dehydrogenase [Clostridiales Family XIII bacterium]